MDMAELVKWLLGIIATLITSGIIGGIVVIVKHNTRLTKLEVEHANLKENLKDHKVAYGKFVDSFEDTDGH